MDATAKILNEFTEKTKVLEDFKNKLNSLLAELLKTESINPHQITCRVKDCDKLKGKIERKGDKYTCLNDITDIVGLRIITYLEDDVDVIAEIVKREFKIDEPNSTDKRTSETDCFGYQSLHYIIKLNDDRVKLLENKKFNGLKAEIQIRSILQHAWAEIEHDLGYKSEIEIPRAVRRNFYRVAALLETADIEFVNIKKTLNEYKAKIPNGINKSPESIFLDKISLSEFIENSNLVRKTDLEIAKVWSVGNVDLDQERTDARLLQRLAFLNINTIKELEEKLFANADKVITYASLFSNPGTYMKRVPQGISLFYLAYLLVVQKEDWRYTELYVIKNFDLVEESSIGVFVDKITRVYEETKKS